MLVVNFVTTIYFLLFSLVGELWAVEHCDYNTTKGKDVCRCYKKRNLAKKGNTGELEREQRCRALLKGGKSCPKKTFGPLIPLCLPGC